jgi:uncharacterized protein (TIGR02246 family)
MKRRWLLSAVPLSCLLASVLPAATAATGLSAADRAAIDSVTAVFTQAARDTNWSILAATFDADAILLPPDTPPVVGRDSIRAYFSADAAPPDSLVIVNDEVAGMGDLAYARGHYRMAYWFSGSELAVDEGKFLTIFRRQPDGRWLFYRSMLSSNALEWTPGTRAGP